MYRKARNAAAPPPQRDTESPFNTLGGPGNGTFLTVDLISARRQVKRRAAPPPPPPQVNTKQLSADVEMGWFQKGARFGFFCTVP